MRLSLTVFTTIVLVSLSAFADERPKAAPATLPSHGDTLTVTAIVDAPIDELWTAFTTTEGLPKAIGVAQAKVDFRVGGSWRTAYKAETDLDSDQAIVNTILAYEPKHFIVLKPTAPAGSPDWLQAICRDGWNVIRFEPVAPDRTRVSVIGLGYQQNPLHDQAYSFFKQGNEATLKHLQKSFGHTDAAAKSAKALEMIKSCIGGEWIAEQTLADGNLLRARAIWMDDMSGNFVRVSTWLGNNDGMHSHGLFVAGRNPETGGVGFWSFGETGDVAWGHMTLVRENVLAMDYHTPSPTNVNSSLYIELRLLDKDHYDVVMYGSAAEQASNAKPRIHVHYKRVAEAPAEFKKLKP